MQYNDCAHCKEPISMYKILCDACERIQYNDMVAEIQNLKSERDQLKSKIECLLKETNQIPDNHSINPKNLKSKLKEILGGSDES